MAELDGDLLRRCHAGDQDALATLIERHAALVRGVCRRVLGARAEAEDAAQAAFLVLARRPEAALRAPALAAWLHVVATRCALRLRAGLRATVPPGERETAGDDPQRAVERSEVAAILDQELARLPARERATFLLCELDGLSQRAAADRLGLPAGSIARLRASACGRLRDALRRRGVVDAGLIVLAVDAAAPTAPPSLAGASARAHATATGVSRTMIPAAPLVSAACCAVVALGSFAVHAPPPRPPAGDAPPTVVAPVDEKAFVVMPDGALWERRWVVADHAWRWNGHGHPAGRPIVSGATAMGDKVFVVTVDGALWERCRDRDAWTWVAHGTPPGTACLATLGGTLDDRKVFVTAADGHLYERMWDAAAWTWVDHGAPPEGEAAVRVPRQPIVAEPAPRPVLSPGRQALAEAAIEAAVAPAGAPPSPVAVPEASSPVTGPGGR